MQYNYFRNLKRQTPVDNRPKYLRYGDVFLSNKDNRNNSTDYNKYNNTTSNLHNDTDYLKYNNTNNNQYSDVDYSRYNNKASNKYTDINNKDNDIDYTRYNKKDNTYDNVNYPRYNGKNHSSYAPNFSTTTITREQVNNLDAANIDRIRTTNQINRNYNNSTKYNNEDDDLYNDIDYINYNNKNSNKYCDDNDYLNHNRSRAQQIYETDTSDAYDNYFFNNNRKVNYQKRQLPPLQQRYSARNAQYDLQYDNTYWEDYDPHQSKHNNKKVDTSLSFKFIWQKFIITFTSILSIVCIAWITYHWHSTANSESNKNNNVPELIEPDKPSFKVLPDTPGGIDIPYQDKSIYSRVDPTFNQKAQENLRVQQEVPVDIPTIPTPIPNNIETKPVTNINAVPIEEYSIIEEKDYYVKCPIDGDKTVAIKQLNLLKKKLSTFPDSDMLENTTCAIRTVANTQGKRGKFILIGPFCDDNTAKQIGHFCKITGEIISVKKANRN